MDSEEDSMSQNEEYEHSSCESFTSLLCTENAQSITQMYEQPLNQMQHGILLLEDLTSSETSWTDEKHSLYLNCIEEAFVSSLYQQGYYSYPCKRLQADRGEAACVFSTDANEEVESALTEDSQSESEMVCIYPNAQNHSKKCRLKDICCSNEAYQEQDKNEKRKRRKLQQEIAVSDRGHIRHVWKEVPSAKHNHEHECNFNGGKERLSQNKNVSETAMKTFSDSEDQVVPYRDNASHRENGGPQ